MRLLPWVDETADPDFRPGLGQSYLDVAQSLQEFPAQRFGRLFIGVQKRDELLIGKGKLDGRTGLAAKGQSSDYMTGSLADGAVLVDHVDKRSSTEFDGRARSDECTAGREIEQFARDGGFFGTDQDGELGLQDVSAMAAAIDCH